MIGGILTALLLKRTALRGPTPTFLIELPPYRLPSLRSVVIRLADRGRVFLVRAGTVIFTVAVIIWALAYFRVRMISRPVTRPSERPRKRRSKAKRWTSGWSTSTPAKARLYWNRASSAGRVNWWRPSSSRSAGTGRFPPP